jgi:hypothetical protein
LHYTSFISSRYDHTSNLCAYSECDAVSRLKLMTADKILNADIRFCADGKREVVLRDKNMNINSVIVGTVVEFHLDEASSVEGIRMILIKRIFCLL